MKEISIQEQKKLLLEMLKFVDGVCRKNDIKYSLVGGSLIGAIRHKGFIPWDDDIDIVLTKENYEKLKTILDDETGRYQTLKLGEGGERFTFTKLIDKKTQLQESCQQKVWPEYGIFIDIFCYYPTASNEEERKKHYKKIKRIVRLLANGRNEFHFKTLPRDCARFWKNVFISNKIIYKIVHKRFYSIMNKYSSSNSEYVINNFLAYSLEKEIQFKEDTDEYIDVEFDGVKAMIFKNYDNILRTTYGNYMELPPESERISRHNIKIWWKENKNA